MNSAARPRRRYVLMILTAVGVLLLLLIGWIATERKYYRVPTASMAPALKVGAHVWVDTSAKHPKLGDIIAFHPPAGADDSDAPVCGNPSTGAGHAAMCSAPTARRSSQTFLKRVVGLPGDQLSLVKGEVIRNGRPEPHSYTVGPCADAHYCTFRATITVPAGEYYVLGDDRGISADSRFWGPIRQSWIVGTKSGLF